MKTHVSAITFILSCALIIFLMQCTKDDEIGPLRELDGDPSGAVINSSVVDYNDTILTIDLDIYVVDGKGNFAGGLSSTNFSIEDTYVDFYNDVTFKNTHVTSANTNPKGSYSATLLLDQSGSISNTDPDNLRIKAAKIFCGALGSNDYVLISSFTSDYSPYEVYYYGDYTQDTTSLNNNLNSLLGKEGGGTPLYSATYSMVKFTNENAPGSNKAIILFTDGNDTEGNVTLQQLTEYANSQGIQIYTVGLSTSVEFEVLADIADETGGAFMWAEDARQLITMFGTLGDLLSGNAKYYQTRWKVRRATGSWSSGSSFVTEMTITLADGTHFLVPFKITIP